jgi:hypothetical protein
MVQSIGSSLHEPTTWCGVVYDTGDNQRRRQPFELGCFEKSADRLAFGCDPECIIVRFYATGESSSGSGRIRDEIVRGLGSGVPNRLDHNPFISNCRALVFLGSLVYREIQG